MKIFLTDGKNRIIVKQISKKIEILRIFLTNLLKSIIVLGSRDFIYMIFIKSLCLEIPLYKLIHLHYDNFVKCSEIT
jgi:hypothetical protein